MANSMSIVQQRMNRDLRFMRTRGKKVPTIFELKNYAFDIFKAIHKTIDDDSVIEKMAESVVEKVYEKHIIETQRMKIKSDLRAICKNYGLRVYE